jgi:hypothetical protein
LVIDIFFVRHNFIVGNSRRFVRRSQGAGWLALAGYHQGKKSRSADRNKNQDRPRDMQKQGAGVAVSN